MRALFALVVVTAAACDASRATMSEPKALHAAPSLSPTRLLRRVELTLRGREPTVEEYRRAIEAAADNRVDAFIDEQITSALASPEFYDEMLEWGHDYLNVGDYKRGSAEGGLSAHFKGGMAVKLDPCASGTLHAGALGHFRGDPRHGDDRAICEDPSATINVVEPWWAPSTTVQVIGRSGTGVTTHNGVDCGVLYMGETEVNFPDSDESNVGCSCGPNLIYCMPRRVYGMYNYDVDANPWMAEAQRRLLFEEPARLFAHVITTDASFADLVTGDYTVAPRYLQFLYARWGRMNPDNAAADASTWWRSATDAWDPVVLETLHPNLLRDRSYTFDPRVDFGEPRGVPAAGVLTQLGPSVWYPRERVRAARYLEIFACRSFTAPDPSVVFTPEYSNDPARGGPCQHCHQTIDPVAIHFKRLEVEDDTPRHGVGYANFGGIGGWSWRRTFQTSFPDAASPGGRFWFQPYGRWNVSFIPDTFLTPATPEQIAANDDARFIDFLPASETLFGLQSDGTIGPLGFGKLLVRSGELDRCAVKQIFTRFMGRKPDPILESTFETELVNEFVAGGRKVKPLIRRLLQSDEFRKGL